MQWPAAAREIAGRTCGCTFCRKHGGVWTSHRDAQLAAQVDDSARISTYRFGTETADFYVCGRCGVVPFVVSEIDERLFAVVNINTFNALEKFVLSKVPADFDGEETADRLDRRKQNWIGNVEIVI